MNPLNILTGLIATGLVLLVGAYTNNNQSLSQAAIKPSVVRLIAIDTDYKSNGINPDNHNVISQKVLSPEGKLIGNSYSACFVVKQGVEYCGGIYNLPTGKITFSGSRQNRSKYVFVVTGGTGSYFGAMGKLDSIVFGTKPFREKIIIHIV